MRGCKLGVVLEISDLHPFWVKGKTSYHVKKYFSVFDKFKKGGLLKHPELFNIPRLVLSRLKLVLTFEICGFNLEYKKCYCYDGMINVKSFGKFCE